MRCFSTSDGQVLVEWAPASANVLKPDGTPLERAWTFHLLDSSGAVVRTWTTTSSAVQEHLSTLAYTIEGDALVCYFHDVAWGREDRPSLNRTVELEGLSRSYRPRRRPRRPCDTRSSATRRHGARRGPSTSGSSANVLARFERALPALAPGERIALVWRYAGSDVVISRSTGEELWRESDWPWLGKELYRRLARVAAEKYGDRLERFEVDVPDDRYLAFDYD